MILILVCWRRRRNSPQGKAKLFEDPDKRVSTVSAIYDTVDEQIELTSNMYNSNAEYLGPFIELFTSRKDSKYNFSDLIPRFGDPRIAELNVTSNS